MSFKQLLTGKIHCWNKPSTENIQKLDTMLVDIPCSDNSIQIYNEWSVEGL